MHPVIDEILEAIPPSLQWPVQTCAFTIIACYVASVITGNVSQVDRIWTFMPTIYTAFFALLPLWPSQKPFPLSLLPYNPEGVDLGITQNLNPRVLLMFGLVVSDSSMIYDGASLCTGVLTSSSRAN